MEAITLVLVTLSAFSGSWACTSIPREACSLSDLKGPVIELYEDVNYQGLRATFTSDVRDLAPVAFANATSSVKVKGAPWLACAETGCSGLQDGRMEIFEEGCYPDLGSFAKSIMSLSVIRTRLNNPCIQVYTNMNAQGPRRVYTREVYLGYSDIGQRVSSHRVENSTWLLSTQKDNQGRKRLAGVGSVLDYSAFGASSFNDALLHLCPLTQGKPELLDFHLLCDQITSKSDLQTLNEILLENSSPSPQLMRAVHKMGEEVGVSETLEFGDFSILSQGFLLFVEMTQFTQGGFLEIGAELRMELEQGFWVEKGVSQTRSRSLGRSLDVEVNVPANSSIFAFIRVMEKSFIIPVRLVLRSGFQIVTEMARIICVDRTNVHVTYTPSGQ